MHLKKLYSSPIPFEKEPTSAIQLLAKIPGITTDWGTDEVNVGKDKNVPVIINGKEVKREYAISINPKRI